MVDPVPEHYRPPTPWFRWRSVRGATSCGGSALLHAALLAVLAMVVLRGPDVAGPIVLSTRATDRPLPGADRFLRVTLPGRPSEVLQPAAGQPAAGEPWAAPPAIAPPEESTPRRAERRGVPRPAADGTVDWMRAIDAEVAGSLAGRTSEARARLAAARGATRQSEGAVERGLRWIMAQQQDDGSWRFDQLQPGNRDAGSETSSTAATGLALLPYLGAGYTHRRGVYQDVVRRGLAHLQRAARSTEHGADLQQGSMYGQGIATIALCEAYAMTDDAALAGPCRQAVRFVRFAQNQQGGGWRYTPGEPGDTTVTGWQLMALKSAQMAGIDVPSVDIMLVDRFLDGVQSDYGARYGYMDPRPRETCSAIGLLCRMYIGWQRDHSGLALGVRLLAREGPSTDNMYLNYYATQVMHHYGGVPWRHWHPAMREHLVATQSRQGQESGSWHFSGGRGDVGGRLYNTAMAVMTLEVYYRHMPLYDLGWEMNDE